MVVGMFTARGRLAVTKPAIAGEADVFGGAGEARDEPPVPAWHSAGMTVQGLWGTDFLSLAGQGVCDGDRGEASELQGSAKAGGGRGQQGVLAVFYVLSVMTA